MTKKDYELIAHVFNANNKIWLNAREQWKNRNDYSKLDGVNKILASGKVIAQGLAHELKKDNPRFDEARFIEACGFDKKWQESKRVNDKIAEVLE